MNDNQIISIVAFMSNLGCEVSSAPSYIQEKAMAHGIKGASNTLLLGWLDSNRLRLFFNWFDTWEKQLTYSSATKEQINTARKYV